MNVFIYCLGLWVVMLYLVEVFNIVVVNVLFKMLEELLLGIMFLLFFNCLDCLLLIILLCCCKFVLIVFGYDEVLGWFKQQGVKDVDVWLVEQGGVLLVVLEVVQGEGCDVLDELLCYLVQFGVDGVLCVVDRLQKMLVVDLVGWVQCWLYDLLLLKLVGVVCYYLWYGKELGCLVEWVDVLVVLKVLCGMGDCCVIVDYFLLVKLFIEEMLIDYVCLFD